MNNVFDQFDTPTQTVPNPFDQFDGHQAAAGVDDWVTPSAHAEVDDWTTPTAQGEVDDWVTPPDTSLSNKAARIGLGLGEFIPGAAQLAAHATGIGTETADSAAKWWTDQEAKKKAEAGLKPEDTDWYGTAGSAASYLVPGTGAVKGIKAGEGLLSLTGRSALQSGIASAAKPTSNIGNFWTQKADDFAQGALAGAALGPVSRIPQAASFVSPYAAQIAQNYLKDAPYHAALNLMSHGSLAPYTGYRAARSAMQAIGQVNRAKAAERALGD